MGGIHQTEAVSHSKVECVVKDPQTQRRVSMRNQNPSIARIASVLQSSSDPPSLKSIQGAALPAPGGSSPMLQPPQLRPRKLHDHLTGRLSRVPVSRAFAHRSGQNKGFTLPSPIPCQKNPPAFCRLFRRFVQTDLVDGKTAHQLPGCQEAPMTTSTKSAPEALNVIGHKAAPVQKKCPETALKTVQFPYHFWDYAMKSTA